MPTAFLRPALLLFLCTLPCWILIRLFFRSGKQHGFPRQQEMKYFLLYAYTVFLAAVTVFPMPFARYNNLRTRGVNLVPIKNTWLEVKAMLRVDNQTVTLHALQNIVGNIILFIPMGLLLPLVFSNIQRFRRVVLTGMTVSVIIESTQWVSRLCGIYRFVDIDDVLLNTLGTAIGCRIAQHRIRRTAPLP
ncbi:VanZ family protein [Sediminibacterium soli]|uniref:VanZ family protein n=1 Tax=Sediminibacterium soli TaxID=2698829 RepID=UPI00137AE981|nr:VanZ family protein [Sediminibacterium soli]NCI46045.1 VanZ family protein [Sediminibacterium soli]